MNRKALCGGTAVATLLALTAFAGPAFAQDDAAEVEEVVVTGSFIAGTPEDAALPVDVIGEKELEARGSPSMVQFIKTIPSSGAVIGENNRFGAGNGAVIPRAASRGVGWSECARCCCIQDMASGGGC